MLQVAFAKEDSSRNIIATINALEEENGFAKNILVSQAALETGWFKYAKGKNLFNMKGYIRWKGKSKTIKVIEYENGETIIVNHKFRVYDTYADSVRDYIEFMKTEPRFKKAWENRNSVKYFQELYNAGYATDPEYVNKLKSIFRRLNK